MNLGCVACNRAGRVALDQRDPGRIDRSTAVRSAQGTELACAVGAQHADRASVVRKPNTADHAQHPVAVRTRRRDSLQHNQCDALRRQESIRLAVERPALPGGRQGAKCGEPGVQKQSLDAIGPAGDHHVRAPGLQPIAGKLDGIQRGGAGGIKRVGGLQPKGRAQHLRRQRRPEPVDRMRLLNRAAPLRLGKFSQGARRVAEIAEDRTDAPALPLLRIAKPGLRQRLARRVQRPLHRGIELLHECRIDREAVRCKPGFERVRIDEPSHVAERALVELSVRVRQQPVGLRAPVARLCPPHHAAAMQNDAPQRFRVQRVRQDASGPDDSDRLKRHGHQTVSGTSVLPSMTSTSSRPGRPRNNSSTNWAAPSASPIRPMPRP